VENSKNILYFHKKIHRKEEKNEDS